MTGRRSSCEVEIERKSFISTNSDASIALCIKLISCIYLLPIAFLISQKLEFWLSAIWLCAFFGSCIVVSTMLGNIVERPSQASQPPTAPRAPTTSTSGFPTILHRSQKPKRPSAFAAASARSAKNTFVGKAVEAEDIPKLAPSSPKDTSSIEAGPSKPRIPANGGENEFARVKREIGDENSRRVAQMTDEERREEVAELQERFGAGVLDALRKRAEKRAAGGVGGRALEKSG